MGKEPIFITVEVPLLDYTINDPFRIRLDEIKVEPILDLRVEATLPPLLPVEIPVIEEDLVHLSILEEYWEKGISFDDVLTAVPSITGELVSFDKSKKNTLEQKLKYLRRAIVAEKPRVYRIEIRPIETRRLPEDIRDRFTIKLRIRRQLTPELKEIIENRLTKELRITRLIKRMEIVRDYRASMELELIISEIERRLGLRRLGGRPLRRGH